MDMIPDDETMDGERLNIIESQSSVSGLSLEKISADLSQFYKLIEFDEGVPFRLVFGKEPGQGCYLFIGDGIQKLTGVSSSDFSEKILAGMTSEIIPLSESMPRTMPEIRQALISGKLFDYKLELRIITADGNEKWIRESSIAAKDECTDKVNGVIGIFHDITERKRVVAYLNEAREKAGENDRLKTTFLQNISHEVRTPLNAIVGLSSILCEPQEEYCRRQECVSMINNSTDHFLQVMDNIMEISRIEAGTAQVEISEVCPDDIIRKVYGNFSQRAEQQGLKLDYIISGNSPLIRTDEVKLLQVINNLVNNAVKFTPSGKIGFGYKDINGSVEFFVSDTGIGIPAEHHHQIFNKFYQVDSGTTRRFPGIGLGLAIARAYVEMLGGSIHFSSEEGAGSTFSFTIPKKD